MSEVIVKNREAKTLMEMYDQAADKYRESCENRNRYGKQLWKKRLEYTDRILVIYQGED